MPYAKEKGAEAIKAFTPSILGIHGIRSGEEGILEWISVGQIRPNE